MRDLRCAAVDDAKPVGRRVPCAVVFARGGEVEGAQLFFATKDGLDATAKLVAALKKSRFFQGTKLVLVHGIALGGLNVIDISLVSKELGVPVIAVTEGRRRGVAMETALSQGSSPGKRLAALAAAGKQETVLVGKKKLLVQCAGCSLGQAIAFLSGFGGFPEPLRLARVFANAVSEAKP